VRDFGKKVYMDEGLSYQELMDATTNKEVADKGYTWYRLEFKKPYDSDCSNQQMLHYFKDPLAWGNQYKYDSPQEYNNNYPWVNPDIPTPEPPEPPVPPTPTYTNTPWVFGWDQFSCFGRGVDYTLTESSVVDVQVLDIGVADKWAYSNNPLGLPPSFSSHEYFSSFGYSVKYDLAEYYYDDAVPVWTARYVCDESSLPAEMLWYERTYLIDHRDDAYDKWVYVSAMPYNIMVLTWTTIDWTQLSFPYSVSWAHTTYQNTYLIDTEGRLWVAGSNQVGCLGTGKDTGYTMIGDATLPNYYAKTYEQVPGAWQMVTGDIGLDSPYVWAMKTDGTIWCCGGYKGGFSTDRNEVTSVFRKISDTSFRIIFSSGGVPMALADALGGYDLYAANRSTGLLVHYAFLSDEDWLSMFGDITPEEYAKAAQGMGTPGNPEMYDYMFVGGDPYLDTFGKQAGSLWWKPNSDELTQLRPGSSWNFAAGSPGYPCAIATYTTQIS